MEKRVFLIVLDSLGIGEMPDAADFFDQGSNTLRAIRSHPAFVCPTLDKLGLFHIDGVGGGTGEPLGCYARMTERSRGKDTTVGHWEIAGLVSQSPLPTYPHGFPDDVIEAFERETGRKALCNRPYSGTQVIRDYGRAHIKSGALIVYTSADSVFQIAAHEDVVSTDELYRACEIARRLLTGKHCVGRVIARPFAGEYPFYRTPRRHDYSLQPPGITLLDVLKEHGLDVIGVGKINDIFAGRGITRTYPTESNTHGLSVTKQLVDEEFEGLCFINLVDFDMVYGHRNDIAGYAAAMTEFDTALHDMLPLLRDNDLLLITADHGCDPSTPSTDHTREYTPLLLYGRSLRQGINLGTRDTFADIAKTILSYFDLKGGALAGESLLPQIHRSPLC